MSEDESEEEDDDDETESLHTESSQQEYGDLPDTISREYLGVEDIDMETEALLSKFNKEEHYRQLKEDKTSLESPDILNMVNKINQESMKGKIRTMTFNCNTALRGKMQQAAKFAQEANADILTIQEPFAQHATINDKEKSRHSKQASDKGYVLDTSKYQAVLIRDRLALHQTNKTTIKNDGRIMAYEFHTNKTTNLLLISNYGVVDGGSRDISKAKRRITPEATSRTTCNQLRTNS